MKSNKWFLPENIDVLGMLRAQMQVTVEGMDAFAAWAGGDTGAAERVRECEHAADTSKRELRISLSKAFTTPLEPEDIFELSRGLDEVLNSAKNAVREAEVMRTKPDAAISEMVEHLAVGTRQLAEAFEVLHGDEHEKATDAADRAVKSQRRLEHVYRAAMSSLIDVEDMRRVGALSELYRRLGRTSEELIAVAERVWYSVLKQS